MKGRKNKYVLPMVEALGLYENTGCDLGGDCTRCNGEMDELYDCRDLECSSTKYITGNHVELTIKDTDSVVKADVVVKKRENLKVCGQIKNCRGNGAAFVNVKLICIRENSRKCIAQTITNARGFYKFNIFEDYSRCEYKIVASRIKD